MATLDADDLAAITAIITDKIPSALNVGPSGSVYVAGDAFGNSLATNANALAIKAKTDNLPSDPADASVIAGLIAEVKAKTDLIGTSTIYPLTGTVTATANASYISIRTNEAISVTVALYDAAGTAVSTVGMTLELIFESGSTEVVITNSDITKSATGFSFTVPSTLNSSERLWTYTCRKTTDEAVLCSGKLEVIYAPNN